MNIPHITQSLNDDLDRLDPLMKSFDFNNAKKNKDNNNEPMDNLAALMSNCNLSEHVKTDFKFYDELTPAQHDFNEHATKYQLPVDFRKMVIGL